MFMWLINGGYCILTNWDDPPSSSYSNKGFLSSQPLVLQMLIIKKLKLLFWEQLLSVVCQLKKAGLTKQHTSTIIQLLKTSFWQHTKTRCSNLISTHFFVLVARVFSSQPAWVNCEVWCWGLLADDHGIKLETWLNGSNHSGFHPGFNPSTDPSC